MYISANELKTGGVKMVKELIQKDPNEVICVNERGTPQCLIISLAYYNQLREYELDAAIAKAKQCK